MSKSKEVTRVLPEHIQPGIKKYGGVIDTDLSYFLKLAGLTYTPYLFQDGRVLLVFPDNKTAFLYTDKNAVNKILEIES